MNNSPAVTTKSVTALQVAIVLTEEQAREFLVDPEPAQIAVRAALAQANHARNPEGRARTGGKSIRLGSGRKAARPLNKVNRAPKASADAEKVQCAKCDGFFTSRGLTKHQNKCKGKGTASAAESPA